MKCWLSENHVVELELQSQRSEGESNNCGYLLSMEILVSAFKATLHGSCRDLGGQPTGIFPFIEGH